MRSARRSLGSIPRRCHDALIITRLAGTDVATGLAICVLAEGVAYSGDISSITVREADTTELSIGIKGQDCIGEL